MGKRLSFVTSPNINSSKKQLKVTQTTVHLKVCPGNFDAGLAWERRVGKMQRVECLFNDYSENFNLF